MEGGRWSALTLERGLGITPVALSPLAAPVLHQLGTVLAAVLRGSLDEARPRLGARAALAVAARPRAPARHHAVQH